jgi:hypothetical protein
MIVNEDITTGYTERKSFVEFNNASYKVLGKATNVVIGCS